MAKSQSASSAAIGSPRSATVARAAATGRRPGCSPVSADGGRRSAGRSGTAAPHESAAPVTERIRLLVLTRPHERPCEWRQDPQPIPARSACFGRDTVLAKHLRVVESVRHCLCQGPYVAASGFTVTST